MAIEAASLYATLGLNSSGYERGMKQARGGLQRFSGVLTRGLKTAAIGGVGALAALGAAGAGIGAKLVGLGSDAEEMKAKFDTVFGTSAQSAEMWLDEFGNAVGRNKFELMEMASTLQDTFVPMGFARGEAARLSTDMTKLAVDVASFNNTLETDVINDFQSALVGNHETVRKYGIVITQATLDQELMRMGIADGIKAATEQQKVMARMNIVMAGTTDAQGDAARTSGSWANQMRALKAQLAEAGTEMGTQLLPIATKFLGAIVPIAQELLPLMVSRFAEFASQLGVTVGPAMVAINDALTRIGAALGLTTGEVTGLDAVMAIFGAGLDAIVVSVELLAVAFQGVASAIEWASEEWDKLKGLTQGEGWAMGTQNVSPGQLLPEGGLGALFGGGRQHGGPVAQGRSYMVGERGPERFVPGQDGYIMPSESRVINLVVDGAVLASVVDGYQGRAARQGARMGGRARL